MEMPASTDRKYDVAISFLVRDLQLAQALYEGLHPTLNVFFYPHNQEELAGTDGLLSMQEPFRHQSRVSVVLYRELWGKTPWTRVEETAIKETCLDRGWETLFFFMIESADPPPIWLPKTNVRFNYADFPLNQAVGAIKARVQEQGGHHQPLNVKKQAELFKADEAYRADRARLISGSCIGAIEDELRSFFTFVKAHSDSLCEQNLVDSECGWKVESRQIASFCVVRCPGGGMILRWEHPYSGSLEKAALYVEFYAQRLILPTERPMYWEQPKPLEKTSYLPELSRLREYGWSRDKQQTFISSSDLADACMIQFVRFVDRQAQKKPRQD